MRATRDGRGNWWQESSPHSRVRIQAPPRLALEAHPGRFGSQGRFDPRASSMHLEAGLGRQRTHRIGSQQGHTWPTLGTIVQELGPGLLTLFATPRGLDVRVTEPVIHDPVGPLPFEAGNIVLAVGATSRDRDAISLISRAGSSGCAAVVFKVGDEVPADVLQPAEAAGVALMLAPLEVGWGRLHALLMAAIAATGQSPAPSPMAAPLGDLFALADAIAAFAGGAVLIEDPHLCVLAYSNLRDPIDELRRYSILARRVPASWVRRLQETGVLQRLWQTNDVVRLEGYADLRPRGRRRMAIAVRAGDDVLGVISVAEGRELFSASGEEALREAARIAASHMIRRNVEGLQPQKHAHLLWSILEGRGQVEVDAARLEVADSSCFTVLALEPVAGGLVDVAMGRDALLGLIALHYGALAHQAACAAIGTTIYVLLPTSAPIGREQLFHVTESVLTRAEASLWTSLRAGVGSTVYNLREVAHSRNESDQVLRILRSEGQDRRLASIEDVWAQSVLIELQELQAKRPSLRSGKIWTLVEHDSRRGTSYIPTLRAYLEAFGNIPKAAAQVWVHPNTFRYRLARLIELSRLDLNDPRERLVTELQLSLL